MERSRFMTALIVCVYSLLAGLSLAMFSNIEQFHRYIFSLLALYIGIRFFRSFDRLALRITFIALAIVFFFVTTLIYAMYIFVKEHPEMLTNAS